eukprot:Partr_v1_DN27698_c1_g1_i2_m65434 putative importin
MATEFEKSKSENWVMENRHLVGLFDLTFNADPLLRSRAENELKQISTQSGFLLVCFEILQSANLEMTTRQAASIYFKNHLKRQWSDMSPNDQLSIRPLLIPAIGGLSPSLRAQILYCLAIVIGRDDNGSWTSFPDEIMLALASSKIADHISAVLALSEYFKVYQWKMGNQKSAIHARLVKQAFPLLLHFGGAVLQNENMQHDKDTLLMLKTILKTFRCCIQSTLPDTLANMEILSQWLQFLMALSQRCKLQVASKTPSSESWMKIQKWTYYIVFHVMSRYGNASSDAFRSKFKKFAKQFIATFGEELVKFTLAEIESRLNGGVILDKSLYTLCNLLSELVVNNSTWPLISGHMPLILEKFAFPLICMNEADEECWLEDPVEYIQRRADPLENFLQPSSAASSLLLTLCRRSSESNISVLNVVSGKLQNPKSSREKEGALNALCILTEHLLSSTEGIANSIPMICQAYVLPELQSQNPLLKLRACNVLTAISACDKSQKIELFESNPSSWCKIFEEITKLLVETEHLPVRIAAAGAIERIMERKLVHDTIAPNVGVIMEAFLRLTNLVDLDLLTNGMERLVQIFPQQIMPFALDLSNQLVHSFLRIVGESAEVTDDVDTNDKMMAAMGILNTLETLILSVPTPISPQDSNAVLLENLERQALICSSMILEKGVVDLFEENFSLLESITSQRRIISSAMWAQFPHLCRIFDEDLVDYIEDIFPLFANFITFAPDVVSSNPQIKSAYLHVSQLILNASLEASERVYGFRLMEVLMLNCRDKIDDLIPTMLDLTLSMDPDNNYFKVFFIEVFLNAFYYNSVITVRHLQSKGQLEAVFMCLASITNELKRVHDRSLTIVALLALTRSIDDCGLRAHLPSIISLMNAHLKMLPAAEKARAELEVEARNGYDSASDDESDGDNAYMSRQAHKFLHEEEGDEDEEGYQDEGEDDDDALDLGDDFCWNDDDLEEEFDIETPLERVNVREYYKSTMADIQLHNPEIHALWISSIPAADQTELAKILKDGAH